MAKNRVEARIQKEIMENGVWYPVFGVRPAGLDNDVMVHVRWLDNSESRRRVSEINWSTDVENHVVAFKASSFRQEIPELMGKVYGGSEELRDSLDFHGKFEDMDNDLQEQIINPKHYKIVPPGTYENGLEYMDICDFALSHLDGVKAHLVGQILKYTLRVGKKDAFLQDSRKIEWYAKRLVETVQKEQ